LQTTGLDFTFFCMDDSIPKLQALLAKKTDTLKFLRDQVATINEEARKTESQITGINEAIQELTPKDASTPKPPGRYSGMTLTQAILVSVKTHDAGFGMRVAEIVEDLKAGGFKSEAKDFYLSVYSILQRLRQEGKVGGGKKDGRPAFFNLRK